MAGVGGVPATLLDGLTILAAGGTETKAVSKGFEAVQNMMQIMHENRIKRLEHAGFTSEQARRLSDLHTPNFM